MSAARPNPTADWLSPARQAVAGEGLMRYSRLVGTLKYALPLVATCLLVVLFIVPQVSAPPSKPKSAASIDATMKDAIFSSRDKQNRAYQVEAPVARQDPSAPGVTNLSAPKAEIELSPGHTLKADADRASYNDKTGTLQLDGALTLKKNDGTTFTTESATVDVNGQNAEGHAPAVLQGSFGEVRGDGFKALDGGKTIIFTGKTKATITLGAPPPGAATPPAPPPTPSGQP